MRLTCQEESIQSHDLAQICATNQQLVVFGGYWLNEISSCREIVWIRFDSTAAAMRPIQRDDAILFEWCL